MKRWLVATAAMALAGCTNAFSPPVPNDGAGQYEVVLDRPFDDVWASIVDHASGTFFGIDNFERDSGLMTLSFGSGYPGDFVDCGTVDYVGETIPTIDYFLAPIFGAPLDSTELGARMNIFVEDLGPDQTRVRVNARYSLAYTSRTLRTNQTWTFSTGESDTQSLGQGQVITCQPTYLAERSILVDGLGAQI